MLRPRYARPNGWELPPTSSILRRGIVTRIGRASRFVNPFDDGRLGGGIICAPQTPVRERELIVRLRVAGRKFCSAAQVDDSLLGLSPGDERAAQRDACFVKVRVDGKRALQLFQSLFCLRASAL